MKTYDRATFEQATRAWTDGEFGDEWTPYRVLAAERGFIYPPEGTPFDQVDQDGPSQRSIVRRAIQDTPRALVEAIEASHSWREVVALTLGWLERREVEIVEQERAEAACKAEFEADA